MVDEEVEICEAIEEQNEQQFKNDLELGEQFQDFLSQKLLNYGIILNNYCSSKYQMEYGENTSGIEIKYDRRFHTTGNLFFEIEAVGKDNTTFIPGGVNKNDSAWLFLCGDEKEIFIFSKSQLRKLATKEGLEKYKIEKRPCIINGEVRSYGMVIPIKKMLENCWCIRHIVF